MLRAALISFFLIGMSVIIYASKGTVTGIGVSHDILGNENTFIINGLEKDSEKIIITPGSDHEIDISGQIFFDDDFFDEPLPEEKREDIPCFSKKHLEKLREDDFRWHYREYTVKRGEHLSGIALKHKTDAETLSKINGIDNPEIIREGQALRVPVRDGVYYKVKKGDSLSLLSLRFGVSAADIAGHNNLKGDRIYYGRNIFIPGGREPVSERAASTVKQLTGKRIDDSDRSGKRISLIWPLEGRITSGFGLRRDPIHGRERFHNGIDISANIGTSVRAAACGEVIFAGTREGYGKMVIVKHDNKYITVYAHNNKNKVKKDDRVKQGDIIAYSGNTGRVTGAHLHFELRKVDHLTPLDPERFLK